MRDEHGHGYHDYVNFFGYDVLERSLKADLKAGAIVPEAIMEYFPQLNKPT